MIDPTVSGHYVGDCRELLAKLPDGCVQTIVTSPPYLWLRSYFGEGDPRRASELGHEASPAKYVDSMVAVFREARRVLRDDGTLWVNLGDSYVANPRGPNGASSSTLTGTPDSERRRQRWQAAGGTDDPAFDKERQRAVRACGLKKKDLAGVPWRVAFALQDDGWWLRSDCIWSKPNPMPESVKDRPTRSHEYVFLLSKSESYFYDCDAVAEPSVWAGQNRSSRAPVRTAMPGAAPHRGLRNDRPTGKRNLRSVWTIATRPYPEAHFATMPAEVAERCVLATSRVGDLVVDPFLGSGTTAAVAEKHGRRWIGFDLGFEELVSKRIAKIAGAR